MQRLLGHIAPRDWTLERREALRAVYEAHFRWIPVDEEYGRDLTDSRYRAWVSEMLERAPRAEPFERPIPGWNA